jgi:hypothetical protein
MSTFLPLTQWCYARLLRLYPASFRLAFADEMADVFALAVQEAAAQGDGSLLFTTLREFAELPVSALREHARERARERARTRQHVHDADQSGPRPYNGLFTARWVARLAALTINLFFLGTFDFGTVLSSPLVNLSFLAQVAILGSILIAWRWEKLGGRLIIISSLVASLTIALPLAAIVPENLTLGFTAVSLLGALVWALPSIGFGWFFIVIARRAQHIQTTGR